MNKNDPAFPSENDRCYYHGLSKREYFVTLILQGLASKDEYNFREKVVHALLLTDTLIEELNKEKYQPATTNGTVS